MVVWHLQIFIWNADWKRRARWSVFLQKMKMIMISLYCITSFISFIVPEKVLEAFTSKCYRKLTNRKLDNTLALISVNGERPTSSITVWHSFKILSSLFKQGANRKPNKIFHKNWLFNERESSTHFILMLI